MHGVFVALFGDRSVDEKYHATLDLFMKDQCTRLGAVTLRMGGNPCEVAQTCMISTMST